MKFTAPAIIFVIFFIMYTILGFSGYGNDYDTYGMLKSGRTLLFDGTYHYSRTPGYFIPEFVIGIISLIGGHVLSNLISSLLGTASLMLFWRLLKRIPYINALLVTTIIGFNPYFVIAASSSMDYVYSLFFGLLGITVLSKKKPFFSSLLFAFAVSSRLLNVLIIGCIYLYFLYVLYKKNERREMTRVFLSGVLAMCLSMLFFFPSFIASGNTLGFLTYLVGDWSFFDYFSRFVYKNFRLFGLVPCVLLAGVTAWNIAKKKIHISLTPEITAGLAIIAVHELLFFNVPFEISYLLPLLFVIPPVFILIVTPQKSTLYIWLGLTVLYSFVIDPDCLEPRYHTPRTSAIGADIGLFMRYGVVIGDVLQREYSKNTCFETLQIFPEY